MYSAVGKALKELVVHRQSLKNAVYHATKGEKPQVIRGTMAMVAKLQDRTKDLEKLLKSKHLSACVQKASFFTAMAMVGDYMISTSGVKGGGSLKRSIVEGLVKAGFDKPGSWANDPTVLHPRNDMPLHRFIRVDLHRITRKNAIRKLKETYKSISVNEDPVLPNVIWIDPSVTPQLRYNKMVIDGTLTMMDRSACLSAQAVDIHPNDTVIDICAAPGSKTLSFISQLAGSGLVIAVEKNPDRYNTLVSRIQKESICTQSREVDVAAYLPLVVQNSDLHVQESPDGKLVVVLICSNFFLFNSCGSDPMSCDCEVKLCLNNLVKSFHPAAAATRQVYMSVDPSCSGSGLDAHKSETGEQTVDMDRVKSLCAFQQSMLDHALKLPIARECLYSTCSLWVEENEQIVQSALKKQEGRWVLCKRIDEWENSELKAAKLEITQEIKQIAAQCYRSDSKTNECRGFFLAVFSKV